MGFRERSFFGTGPPGVFYDGAVPPLKGLGCVRLDFARMKYQFDKHYTREEASALLPPIRVWLQRLNRLSEDLERLDQRLRSLAGPGNDIGGESVNNWIRTLSEMQEILAEFQSRQIFIQDLSRGLIDFPAIIGGREVFLCWESDEENVEFWHGLETGYAGRKPL